ncbi:RNA-processing protein [Candidatus Bathyarchaeota archaeon]|jgi:ribosomal RNA assembly protein|nr:RNA-processing protein [Candidatus Bathyarchaeota archaeon]
MQTKFNVTIPQDRIGALVGEEGKIKQSIESTFKAKLNIDSESGIVELTLTSEEGDAASLLKARDIVTAIGRGFSPDRAFGLRDDEIILDVIDLREIFGRNDDTISRIKGRVIGRGGKIRKLIEELTKTDVSVYGHTISLIGDYDSISIAREAILMLLEGKQHSTVYKFLRQRRREQKIKRITELWEPTK